MNIDLKKWNMCAHAGKGTVGNTHRKPNTISAVVATKKADDVSYNGNNSFIGQYSLDALCDWGFGASSWPAKAFDTSDLRFGDSGMVGVELCTPEKKLKKWFHRTSSGLFLTKRFENWSLTRWRIEKTGNSWRCTSLRCYSGVKYWRRLHQQKNANLMVY